MVEVKLIPTMSVAKPALAIVIGVVIVAEPDATRGVHWEKNQTDMFAIIDRKDIDEFTQVIYKLNENATRPLSEEYRLRLAHKIRWFKFNHKILEYMKFN